MKEERKNQNKEDYDPAAALQFQPTHPKKEPKKEEEECPLCKISEETIKRLKEKGKSKKGQEKIKK